MKKVYLILAAVAGMTITSCTNNDFVGEVATQTNGDAISFGGGTSALTRADKTGPAAATLLSNEMKVYGMKYGATDPDATTPTTAFIDVFTNYTVNYDESKAGNDEYNEGWYYVGAGTNQSIKYWDYSSDYYRFVAGSPVDEFTYTTDATNGITSAAIVSGLGGRLNHSVTVASTNKAVYIADPVEVKPANYKKEVQFRFKSVQTKVRVGIYETIPGYKITNIQFYADGVTEPSQYITLNSATADYFHGCTGGKGTITYDWTTTPASYTFEYDAAVTAGKYWEGGQFTSGVPATTSAATNLYGADASMASDGYFIVMPTPSATTATPLTLTCDYTLTALDNGEKIKVTGATATIPADYTKWKENYAYTYLFKITDNTNGSTGTDPDDPEGLFPIVFDAVVVDFEDGQVGTETTVSTPSITVYQDGDVVENGITYKAGDVVVKAMNTTATGVEDVTSTCTWSYFTIDGTTFDYGKNYEKLGTDGAATSWTTGALTSVAANKTYVIKAVVGTGDTAKVAYFVLVVGAAENGPANS